MTDLASLLFGSEIVSGFGMWAFLSVGAVVMFGVFIPTVTFMDARRKEREAFYKAETIRRLAESSGEGAKAAIELMQQDERIKQVKVREGLKIGGVVNVGIGIGLTILLRAVLNGEPEYLCGLIPLVIGAALLVYVYFMAPPVERPKG